MQYRAFCRWLMGSKLCVLLVLGATGCHGYRSAVQHVEDPGVHVVTSPSGHSVVWSDGKQQRVCTLSGSSSGVGHHRAHASKGAHPVDAALFHLCEARANGDLSAEQYAAAVNMVLAHMARRGGPSPHGGCSHGSCPFSGGHGHGHGGPHGKWHGQHPGVGPACPHCKGKHPMAPAPEGEAAPPAPQRESL